MSTHKLCFIKISGVTVMSTNNVFIENLCVEVLWPSQPNGVMSSAVSLPNHTFYWAGLVL